MEQTMADIRQLGSVLGNLVVFDRTGTLNNPTAIAIDSFFGDDCYYYG